MRDINWDDVEDAGMIPPGKYICRVIIAEELLPDDRGSKYRWDVRFEVLFGDERGREFHDSFFFTERALPRLKLLYECCGLRTTGRARIDPDDLKGQTVQVTVGVEKYVDRQTGERKEGRKVPYNGYEKAPRAERGQERGRRQESRQRPRGRDQGRSGRDRGNDRGRERNDRGRGRNDRDRGRDDRGRYGGGGRDDRGSRRGPQDPDDDLPF